MAHMMQVFGESVDISTLPLLGEGGTAWVYDLSSIAPGKVIKVFKTSRDFAEKEAQRLVTERLEELLERLKAFPELPPGVAGPEGIILERGNMVAAVVLRKVSGYSLAKLSDWTWRRDKRFGVEKVKNIFLQLGSIWSALHRLGLVVGDVKPDNVMIEQNKPIVIDVEGVQFGKFPGRGFTPEYVDPLICTLTKKGELLASKTFSPETDWYSFGVMLFEALTFVHPYGGTLWASKCSTRVEPHERPLKGLSVFSDAVSVPKFAVVNKLPQELTEYFRGLFAHEHRKHFPLETLGRVDDKLKRCVFHAVPGGLSSSAYL